MHAFCEWCGGGGCGQVSGSNASEGAELPGGQTGKQGIAFTNCCLQKYDC